MKLNLSWVKTRQTKYGAYLAVYVLVVVALLSLANWFVNRNSKSWDLTANKQYSLSGQTKKIVGNLENEVKIYHFDRQSQFDRARDLLNNYDSLSGKLSVEYIDPDRKPGPAREMQVKSYGTTILVSGAKREEANVLDEESVTSALIRLTRSGSKKIYFVEGHGEGDINNSERQGYSSAKKALEDSQYQVETVSLLRDPKVPEDAAAVVVAGPKTEYLETEVDAIRRFVEGGGRAMFLLEPGMGEKLAPMLADWNVELKGDLIIDLNEVNQLFGASETMPIITGYKSHAITRELGRVATLMPLSRSVQPAKESKPDVTVDTLFETSAESWATGFSAQMREVRLQEGRDTKGPIPMAVAGTVRKSGSEAPAPLEGEAPGPKEGRFVVVGSSRFPANNYIGFNGNKDLFVNMVNWLASDEDLISIRPKSPENRRVNLTVAQMRNVFFLSVVGLPLLMLATGVAVWWRRR